VENKYTVFKIYGKVIETYKMAKETNFCPTCGNEIDKNAEVFPESGVVDETVAPYVKKKSAVIAVILSFLVPGLGQICYGQIRGGILFIIISIILLFSILILILGYILWPLFW
jgi:hypothetical protein